MTLNIVNVRDRVRSGVIGRKIQPKYIVLHYTADSGKLSGPDDAFSSLNALNNRGLSCQYLLSRNGTVLECCDWNQRTSHAGSSRWKGIRGLNNHTVGIEISNAGWLNKFGPSTAWREWKGNQTTRNFPSSDYVRTPHRDHPHWDVGWEVYNDTQMENLEQLVLHIQDLAQGQIEEVIGHDHIAPDRKQDPGPLMDPMYPILNNIIGDGDYEQQREKRVVASTANTGKVIARSGLNVRPVPGTSIPAIDTLSYGTVVSIVSEHGDWLAIDMFGDGGVDGYVFKTFVEKR